MTGLQVSTTAYRAADYNGSRQGAMVAMLNDRRELSNKHHTSWVWSDQCGEYLLMVAPKGVFIDTMV